VTRREPTGPSWLRGSRGVVLLVALACVPHLADLGFDFSGLDDGILIEQNASFLFDPANAPRVFTRHVFAASEAERASFYRPLMELSLLLDAQWGGIEPFAFHATNVALLALATALFFVLLVTLGVARPDAWLAALLFGVHPLTASAVAWIPGRNDTLLAVFALLAILTYLRWLARPTAVRAAAHGLAFAAALFTKEAGAALVPLLIVVRLAVHSRARPARREVAMGAGWIVLAGVWLAARSAVVEPVDPGFALASLVRHVPEALPYLGKVIAPFDLSSYPIGPRGGQVAGIVAVGLAIAGTVAALRHPPVDAGRARASLLVGGAWFALFLLPTFVIAEPRDRAVYYEHRMVLPLLGLLLAVAGAGAFRIVLRCRWLTAGVVLLAAGLATLTFLHSRDWRDPLRFWRSAAAGAPRSPVARAAHGTRLAEAGRLDEARRELEAALALYPDHADALYNLGLVQRDTGNLTESEATLARAVEVRPDRIDAHFHLGVVRLRLERPREALEAWRRALGLDPAHVPSLEMVAMTACRTGRRDTARQAIDAIRRAGAPLRPEVRRVVGPCLE